MTDFVDDRECRRVGSRTDGRLTFCRPSKSKQKSATPAEGMTVAVSLLAATAGGVRPAALRGDSPGVVR